MKLIQTKELVHGKELEKEERKVLVMEVYNDNMGEAEEEEFLEGAFVRVHTVKLRKLPFKKKTSKKKGRGHIRGMSPEKWSKNKRKKLRNSGKTYVSSSGKEVPEKNLKNITCNCKYKKCGELTIEARQTAHAKFWTMGDYNNQNAFLLTQIRSVKKEVLKHQKKV